MIRNGTDNDPSPERRIILPIRSATEDGPSVLIIPAGYYDDLLRTTSPVPPTPPRIGHPKRNKARTKMARASKKRNRA